MYLGKTKAWHFWFICILGLTFLLWLPMIGHAEPVPSPTPAGQMQGQPLNANSQGNQERPPVVIRPGDPLPKLTARTAILIEAKTGHVLYERDADARMFPASTTKIMTLILALESGHLDDVVTVSKQASDTEGSTIWLNAGEHIPMRDLLYGMMLVSGNDATVAVAEHLAGSVPAFARLMTQKAHEIGAQNTSFVNSSGLPDPMHYTTARDLATIAAYGYRNPLFAPFVSTREIDISGGMNLPPRHLRSENLLLYIYPGANGVKTGYTEAAGRCFVGGAERNGVQLISVVLDSEFMWNDSIALLNYGFAQVSSTEVVKKGENEGFVHVQGGRESRVPVLTSDSITLPTFVNMPTHYQTQVELPKDVKAPVQAGDAVGRLVVTLDGKEVASTSLIIGKSVERKSFFLWLKEGVTTLAQTCDDFLLGKV